MNLPNGLTVGRIALIPVFVALFYAPFPGAHIACAFVFLLAAITDWLDGYLARKLAQTSAFGAFLDPVADKLMVAFALVLLIETDPHPWVAMPAGVIICREIAVSALREWMAELGARAKVSVAWIGKLKTIAQIIAIIAIIVGTPGDYAYIYSMGLVLLYVSVTLTIWSMFTYLRAAWPNLRPDSD